MDYVQRSSKKFKITPLEESAVALAGVSTENIGLVTLTFHASWKKGEQPPSDEPTHSYTKAVDRPKYREVQVHVTLPDGRVVTETRLETQTNQSYETATGFGTEVNTDLTGVVRNIGVPRAVVAFRYNR